MSFQRLLPFGCALVLGVLVAVLVPASWFLGIFLFGIAAVVLLGILVSASAKESPPQHLGVRLVSFFVFGTGRPTAAVQPGIALTMFQLGAVWLCGMGIAIVWLGNA